MFVTKYYSNYDNDRKVLYSLFDQQAGICWNGNLLNLQSFGEMLTKLPETKHKVNSYDVQLIQGIQINKSSTK